MKVNNLILQLSLNIWERVFYLVVVRCVQNHAGVRQCLNSEGHIKVSPHTGCQLFGDEPMSLLVKRGSSQDLHCTSKSIGIEKHKN